jgi:hypothetical protein
MVEIVPQIRIRPRPSTSLPFHLSLIVLPFDPRTEQLTASLRKSYVHKYNHHHWHNHHHWQTPLLEPRPSFEDSALFHEVSTYLDFTTIIFLQSKVISLVSNPEPGEPGPCIYVPQWQGGPIIPPGSGFPFRRLLRLAELRWRFSKLSPKKN